MAVRSVLILIGLLFSVWFLLPFLYHRILNMGNITGIVVSILIIMYGLKMPIINSWIKAGWNKNISRILLSIVGLSSIVIIVLVLVITGCMVSSAKKNSKEGATVVVLGCRVYGERASLMLAERLDAAYEYLTSNPEARCIVSGGQGSDEDISEAECMYRYLVAKGIDKDRVVKEDQSTSTRENLRFSYEIIQKYDMNTNIAIITNEFHEYRAGRVADTLGLEYGAVSARTAWWLFPTYYVRELYGILYEWVF